MGAKTGDSGGGDLRNLSLVHDPREGTGGRAVGGGPTDPEVGLGGLVRASDGPSVPRLWLRPSSTPTSRPGARPPFETEKEELPISTSPRGATIRKSH